MIEQLKGLNADVDILKTWFVLDENAIPPVYVLQPISSRIPDFLAVVSPLSTNSCVMIFFNEEITSTFHILSTIKI